MIYIWMNFRGCDRVLKGMPVTVIPYEIYHSNNYYYKNGLSDLLLGTSGIVERVNRKTLSINFGNGIIKKVDKVQTGLYVPYDHVCTHDGKIIHKNYFRRVV